MDPARAPIEVSIIQAPRTAMEHTSKHVPLLISILALLLSIWSAFATREHNKLTVRPFVSFVYDQAGAASETTGISLKNEGFAAAKIEKPTVFFGEKMFTDWQFLKSELAKLPEPVTRIRWRILPENSALREGDAKFLFSVDTADIPPTSRESYNQLLRKVDIFVRVCSIYDDCELLCTLNESLSCEREFKRLVALQSSKS